MNRGDVYWADLVPRSGSEQTGRRPVIVISNEAFNRVPTWKSIIVIPMTTSSSQAARRPTAVPIPQGVCGLSKPGIAICHQVTTLDRGKIGKRIGSLPWKLMEEIEDGLRAAMSLD